jgi:hypothetical protein
MLVVVCHAVRVGTGLHCLLPQAVEHVPPDFFAAQVKLLFTDTVQRRHAKKVSLKKWASMIVLAWTVTLADEVERDALAEKGTRVRDADE